VVAAGLTWTVERGVAPCVADCHLVQGRCTEGVRKVRLAGWLQVDVWRRRPEPMPEPQAPRRRDSPGSERALESGLFRMRMAFVVLESE